MRIPMLPAALALLLLTPVATAGERVPISTLPVLPAMRPLAKPARVVTGMKLDPTKARRGSAGETTAATKAGYCLVHREDFHLQETDPAGRDGELWRFVEKDDAATLESTRFEIDAEKQTVTAVARTSIALAKVAREGDVTVWGYREPVGHVVLLTARATNGRESSGLGKDEEGMPTFVWSGCSFAVTRIAGKLTTTGAVAELRGWLPPRGEGKNKVTPEFVVHGSVARVGRDPEPILAVRVLFPEPFGS
jgi:hypothetical protein